MKEKEKSIRAGGKDSISQSFCGRRSADGTMPKINVLDSTIFNRIAAGEVVESPMSVVKELVENSIDAKAQNITIEIKNGGIDYIRITDDGYGIEADEIEKAFLPHATSKIKDLSDLEKIMTLGFRGEALPSIASVAKVSVTSRVKNSDLGYCVTLQNGKKIFESEIGAPLGTTVTVENIFDNVPARKKFLKKPSIEGAKIVDLVQKLILANYNTGFKFINNGETIYHSSNSGLEQSVYIIYGDTVKNLDFIENISPEFSIKGYISKPSFSKHNKSYQTLIVNGRVVENEDISYYIYLCYQDYLMKRQYPMYIIYIDLPYDMIDVNVHPNKMNVKFSDINRVKNFVMGAVKKSINKEFLIPADVNKSDKNSHSLNTEDFKTEKKVKEEVVFTSDIFKDSLKTEFKMPDKTFKANFKEPRQATALNNTPNRPNASSFYDINPVSSLVSKGEKQNADKQSNILNLKPEYVFCGKIFNTYLIVQEESAVYLIDQHAAHEKLLYDKLISSIDKESCAVQNLLLPYVFEVTASEKNSILDNLDRFNELGFAISQFGGNIFSLSSVPVLCQNINLKDFISILIENIKRGSFKKSEFIKESVMQAACKAAVKGYDDLSKAEAQILIDEMLKNGGALFCPHGRPIVVKLTKNEIEKWFKRIN